MMRKFFEFLSPEMPVWLADHQGRIIVARQGDWRLGRLKGCRKLQRHEYAALAEIFTNDPM